MTPYERTVQHATHTASMLKLIAHPHRLMILCLLAESEHNVTELVKAVGINQTAVSNHLAKMRADGIVDYTRYHRVLQYRLISPEVRAVLDTINGQCLHREDADGTSEQAS
ncbi:MAG: metalloregulator ArsR/SmtB family transcription factor [Neisseria sp.]|nr:metalloregulator ArsR/SmtB family transcription factor [Neisseria sp.]